LEELEVYRFVFTKLTGWNLKIESTSPAALGAKWDEKMEPAFIANIVRYRRYKFDSVWDLSRVM